MPDGRPQVKSGWYYASPDDVVVRDDQSIEAVADPAFGTLAKSQAVGTPAQHTAFAIMFALSACSGISEIL